MAEMRGSVEALRTAIEHAARAHAQRVLEQAEHRAAHLRQEAQQEADRLREAREQEAEEAQERTRRERRAKRFREAQRDYLATRERLIDDVWAQAERRLRELTQDEAAYAGALQRMTIYALRGLGPGDYELTADEAGQELLSEERLQRWREAARETLDWPEAAALSLRRAETAGEQWGGVLISATDGRRRVDMRFDTRLALARDRVRDEVFKTLMESQ